MPIFNLKQLSLKNFKCHQDIKIPISPLTILAGSNASGKSSIMQSILIANKAYLEADKQILQTNDICGINLGLPVSIISSSHDSEEITISLKIGNNDNIVILKLFDANIDSLSFKILNCDDIISEKEEKDSLNKQNIYYINAERFGPRISSNISDINELYVGSKGENTNYVISKMDLLEKNKPNDFQIDKRLIVSDIDRFSANCEKWLDIIIPDTELSVKTEHELNLSTIRFKNQGDYYLPTATGFGITYVLPIIVQSLVATIKQDSILLIENPEAHLHPYSQSAIGKFLAYIASCGVQVIIETHSEHVINGCRLQLAKTNKTNLMNIIFFNIENTKSKAQVIKVNGLGELEFWPEGFFDQTKRDLKELLELRRCGK